MEDLQPNITIEEFDGKKFQIQFFNPENSAVVTHYLHNYRNGVKQYFEKDALNFISSYVDYKTETESSNIIAEQALQHLLSEVENVPFPTPENYNFTFIDLFAGVGGFRMALQNTGGKCVYTSEYEPFAKKTYRANYGEVPFGDITKQNVKDYIPKSNIDVLCAGFPCQPFSIAGYQKGFSDTRGTLFFDIEQIIEKHKPRVVFLENVKNFVSHDNGKTFKVVKEILENKLGYKVFHKVLNSMKYANIPQNRERIFIVAFDPKQVEKYSQFKFVA